jgi:hypothetical protein
MFRSNRFVVYSNFLLDLLLPLLLLSDGLTAVCLKGDTLLLAFLNLEDYVSDSYTDDLFVGTFFGWPWFCFVKYDCSTFLLLPLLLLLFWLTKLFSLF